MKTKHFLLTGTLCLAFAAFVLNGCKKESNNNSTDTDTTAAQDEANANFAIQDSKSITDGAAKGQSIERMANVGCGTWVKRDTTINSQLDTLIVVTFPGNCQSPDGRTRKGAIFVYWSGKPYFDSGSVATMVFSAQHPYSVTLLNGNTITVTGTRQATNIGKDSAGDMSWTFNANLTLTYSGNVSGTATWSSNRTYTLVKEPSGYFYQLTGPLGNPTGVAASGTTRNGVSYTISILQPLYHTAYWLNMKYMYQVCDCFEAGEVEITRTGKQYPLYLTFTSGVGNCNHTATATINNKSYNITLP